MFLAAANLLALLALSAVPVALVLVWRESRRQRLDDEARMRAEYAAKLARCAGQRIGTR